tara:strand:- start:148 stop:342 length:195 start_codon:yes stop_codon:yes gene_type:complete
MKINTDKLKLFENEGDLRAYLKVNGISGAAIDEHIAAWKSAGSEKPIQKVTMVATETDATVETK